MTEGSFAVEMFNRTSQENPMYPMRPQMPMLPQQAQMPAQAPMTTYPMAAQPMQQGIGAFLPQQVPPMAMQRMPFGQAPVMGMAEGGPVTQSAVRTAMASDPRMMAMSGKGRAGTAPQRTTGPDGYGLAQIMRTGTPEERMAALRQMRAGQAGQAGFGGKGVGRPSSPQQTTAPAMNRMIGMMGGR